MNDILKQMVERLNNSDGVFKCIKCAKLMKDIICEDHKCTGCGYPVGKSASMQVEIVFKGIDVPPELMAEMKEELERSMS